MYYGRQLVEKVIFRQAVRLRETRADEEKAAVGVQRYGRRLGKDAVSERPKRVRTTRHKAFTFDRSKQKRFRRADVRLSETYKKSNL